MKKEDTEEIKARELDLGDLKVDKRTDKRTLVLTNEEDETTIKIEGYPEVVPDIPAGETVHFKIYVPQTKVTEF